MSLTSKEFILFELLKSGKVKTFDYARPVTFNADCKLNGINPDMFVWDYTNDKQGKALNIVEAYNELTHVIRITNKRAYGRDNFYPACDISRRYLQFTGRLTFTAKDIQTMTQLGHEIAILVQSC